MRRLSLVVSCGFVAGAVVGACTLTTDLDGYAGPEVSTPQDASDMRDVTHEDVVADTTTRNEAAAGDAYRALVMSDRPIGYWRLDDATAVAKDEAGQHDGTYMGTVSRVSGVLPDNGAASFDSGSYIALGNVFGFTGNAAFSIEAWTAPTVGNGSDPACLAAKDHPGTSGVSDGWALYLGGDLSLLGSRWMDSTQQFASAPKLTAGVFTHVVMTYDGKSIVVFENGTLAADLDSTIAIQDIAEVSTIGASRGGTSCFFHGVLDEVAFYDRALTNDQVLAHYNAGKP